MKCSIRAFKVQFYVSIWIESEDSHFLIDLRRNRANIFGWQTSYQFGRQRYQNHGITHLYFVPFCVGYLFFHT